MMMDDMVLSRELSAASRVAAVARLNLESTPLGSPDHQSALVAYLQATTRHAAIVTVAQAHQLESLAADVDELRDELAKLRARVAAMR